MPTIGNPIFNWNTPCLEQELIRWEDVVDDNFRINKTENEFKAEKDRIMYRYAFNP